MRPNFQKRSALKDDGRINPESAAIRDKKKFAILIHTNTFATHYKNRMIDTLITSKTRIKLLTRLFLNPETTGYLRGLAEEFGESSNAIRLELNRFEEARLLTAGMQGNKKIFRANTTHPLFGDINSILRKHLGLDHIIEKVAHNLGDLHSVYLTGNYAGGKPEGNLELLFVGNNIKTDYLDHLIKKAEKMISRNITTNILTEKEITTHLNTLQTTGYLLLWQHDKN
jgi:hypothetical protein